MKTIQKIIIMMLIMCSYALSVTLSTTGFYAPNKNITVQIQNQAADNRNWIGIYPKGSSNAWGNVVTWEWTKGKSSVNLGGLAKGSYEARLFYNNSFHLEASTPIEVDANAVSVKTSKAAYGVNENITVNTRKFPNKLKAWVGIYPAASNNDWGNVLDWRWAQDKKIIMDALPKGKYEVRLFFNNSFKLEASYPFTVGDNTPKIHTTSAQYKVDDKVSVSITGALSGDQDWVGIFPKNSTNSWGNVIQWKWVPNNGTYDFVGLPTGTYEVRLFFHNEYGANAVTRASDEFSMGEKEHAKKKLILHGHSGGWAPMMAPNLIKRANFINSLPFSGYTVVGNTYTNKVMKRGETLTYNAVWNELKGLKGLYPNKSNFLTVWMYFPGDLWDDTSWNRVTNNFKIVAKVAKDLGFAGIVYDDEAYVQDALKLINYDKDGWFDYRDKYKKGPKVAHKNPNYTFLAHTEKITARFKTIMQGMVSVFPSIDVLFYHSPAEGHIGADDAGKNNRRLIKGAGPEAGHELTGAMFLGLKRGLSNQASLNDMGEDYSYRKVEHFEHAYQWRKYTIASDATNNAVDATEHWRVPKADRATWSKEISEGFMVTNLSLSDPDPEFDTRNKVGLNDMKTALERALDRSDEYVVFYSASSTNGGHGNAHLDWLQDPNGTGFSIDGNWLNMMRGIYNSKLK